MTIAQQRDLISQKTELFLKYPESLGIHSQVSYENAVQYLLKAHQLAISVPFQWGYIDRPQDGSLFIAFLVPQQHTFPNDGIRYQDQERRFSIPTGQGRVGIPSISYHAYSLKIQLIIGS